MNNAIKIFYYLVLVVAFVSVTQIREKKLKKQKTEQSKTTKKHDNK